MKYILYFFISTFRSVCAVPNMAIFCSSLVSCFTRCVAQVFSVWFWDGSTCPYYYWNHFCSYIAHAVCFYGRSLYCRLFLGSFLITFLPSEVAVSISLHVPVLNFSASWGRVLNGPPQLIYRREGDLVPIIQKMGRAPGPVWTSVENLVAQDSISGPSIPPTICQPSLAYLLVIVKHTKSFLKVSISFF